MNYTNAVHIVECIEQALDETPDSGIRMLWDEVVRYAVAYAECRVHYHLSTLTQKGEQEAGRTVKHTAFIDACNILSRNMARKGLDISWREELGGDRKTIGDFACYLYCILGIRAR